MHVIFVEPRFPSNQARFVHALREVGAGVSAVGEAPAEALGDDLRGALLCYEQVPSVCHEPSLLEAVRSIQKRGWVDRLEASVEAHILPVARVRAECGIPGTSERTAFLCRDKPAMKEALHEAGVPTPRSMGASTVEEVMTFIAEVGYPVILKPRASAGAAGTYRADDAASLERAMHESGLAQGHSVALEQFVVGHEGFYDTLTFDGEVVHEFISHYYPNVLEAMRTRWISPQIVSTNRLDAPGYEELRRLGAQVNQVLGIGTSATHMEWFFGPKGMTFSEIGCRPPGVSVWDLHGAGNDMDLYHEWAHLIVHGRPDRRASRRFATGMIALRPDRDGHIAGYEGEERVRAELGEWLLDAHLPPPGSPTQPVEAGYKANAWLRVRHPDYDELRRMLDFVGQTLKVRAAPA